MASLKRHSATLDRRPGGSAFRPAYGQAAMLSGGHPKASQSLEGSEWYKGHARRRQPKGRSVPVPGKLDRRLTARTKERKCIGRLGGVGGLRVCGGWSAAVTSSLREEDVHPDSDQCGLGPDGQAQGGVGGGWRCGRAEL